MPELSIVIPFCNEYPQVLFTVRNIAEELLGRVDFEIIAVNNYCEEVEKQNRIQDKGFEALEACQGKGNPWLRVLHYGKKLSHWNSKNWAVKHSSAKFLWFVDAHCMVGRNSLFNMFNYYKENYEELNGTLHMPLTYKILEYHRLIYKLVVNESIGEYHYSFTTPRDQGICYQVPCMSCCGVMMTRDIYNQLGGWPERLGIYGGGEHFINFTSAILGKTINIFSDSVCYHHGEKRGYNWNYDDYTRNRIIATYMFGGTELARKYTDNRKGSKVVLNNIFEDVITSCKEHREFIKANQKITIQEWAAKWLEK